MTSYIGITIGPIMDTMELSSSPAALWGSSYFFSFLAHEIRVKLDSGEKKGCDDKAKLNCDDIEIGGEDLKVGDLFERGVGLYHDRIIYESNDMDAAGHAIEESVKSLSNHLTEALNCVNGNAVKEEDVTDFLKSYLNIHAVLVEVDLSREENALIKVNTALDALELKKNFPVKTNRNYILELLESNGGIKNSYFVTHGKNNYSWVLLSKDNKGNIRDLKDISSDGSNEAIKDKKFSLYYAVIRADGDNMGKSIKNHVTKAAELKDFSDRCFRYAMRASRCVDEYGGVTIYAGGDDLLAIVPVMATDENGKYRSFIDLVNNITDEFNVEFGGYGPQLSFGVQIQYYKAPLYEALNKAGELLFGISKSNKPNAISVNLLKHSGQSAAFLVRKFSEEDSVLNRINECIKNSSEEKQLNSVGNKISQHALLFSKAVGIGNDSIENYFANIFDDIENEKDKRFLERIKKIAEYLPISEKVPGSLDLIVDSGSDELKPAELMGNVIHFIRFFSESKGEE